MTSDERFDGTMNELDENLRERVADALGPLMEREIEHESGAEAGMSGAHPDVDQLIRYHGGALDAAEEERVQRHLVACPRCLEDLLDLDELVAAGASPARQASETEPEAVSHLPGAPPSETPPEAGSPRSGPPWLVAFPSASRRAALALAASILVVISGLAFWAVRERTEAEGLRDRVATLSAPRPDVPIVDLLPDSALRGGPADGESADGGQPPGVELPAGEEHFTLVLNLPGASESAAFEAKLVDAEGRVTWSGPLHGSPYGTFTLGLSRRHLAPGENRILLYGADPAGDGSRRLLETYTVRLEPVDPLGPLGAAGEER